MSIYLYVHTYIYISLLSEENSRVDYVTGLEIMEDLLAQLDDKDLVMKYASWIMKKDEVLGAKVYLLSLLPSNIF